MLGILPCHAIILFGLDNSGNLTDPGGGLPFDSVGLLSDASQANPSGSAVHLGNGYMLTANHVTMMPLVTFDGTTFYTRDLSYTPQQVAANVDMQIFKLTTIPTVGSATLYNGTAEQTTSATLVGWGVGRDPSVVTGTASVAWGSSATVAKRWGFNAPENLENIAYQAGSYEAIRTTVGSPTGTPAGFGTDEAAATLYDSGSALFQNIGGTWYLIGLTTAVEVFGTSLFGNDAPGNANSHDNFFVRVGNHDTTIAALIPEPSTSLLLLGFIPLSILHRRR